jgi:hypothetical protein
MVAEITVVRANKHTSDITAQTSESLSFTLLRGRSGEIELIESEREGKKIIVGAFFQIQDRKIFVERNPLKSEEEIRAAIEGLLNANWKLNSENHLTTESSLILQLGAETEKSLASGRHAFLAIDGEVNPKSNTLKNEGSLQKNDWRLRMADFAEHLFQKGLAEKDAVVFMPGATNAETDLWVMALRIKLDQMIMIEGDPRRFQNLKRKFERAINKPKLIDKYLGEADHNFAEHIIRAIGRRNASIVSLDTESAFNNQLYSDLVQLFRKIPIDTKLMLALNLVARAPHKTCREFLESAEKRLKIDLFEDNIEPRALVMKNLVKLLLLDSGREDLYAGRIYLSSYLGAGATSMEYLFAEIRRRNDVSSS